ncbi:anti-sigma-factor antagonist [Catenulispora acidiphila DSM 44928]|uniref:Anti-sigma factor antagonist n=1 Tax=Catenulispora acidiphila (strain DSM 44928 / JCM 14897 / NBRC 102108 / NRRL B-24433 / ID139908) TaxID=479433 RepID=C7Q704_CATAD|nr:STAS domain-containing protein [Catenulispora acidiphila]ACU76017.1 anti-sigma-factor antagonist [Catenulispora acidiphila DSM 44928]
MEFSCTVRQIADRVVLTVAGDVDLAVHGRFEADVEQYWDASTDLVIDCSRITFLDSMGLRVLVHAMQRAAGNGRDIAIAAPSDPVLRVLDLAGIRSLFTEIGPVADAAPDPDPAT